ncbi:MAG: Na/Pi cotransporter family protein [Intestinibacter sp.]|uniref:Na/Pi cotransporter family protein n=1 Tax=Intestinibacter sp. TaxID=1965304 RepID=UPI0025BFE45E|nr:Na/Pi cotransporter family protein [Intestinibacter sp.]MCI6736813.1 Na/Pi cotransporter family protein [Intestinibacter sp.]
MGIAISLLGGLGLFLYGMNMMGDGLQKCAGDQLKKIIGFLTSNVVMGVLVGTVVTGIIQSSSATTVMVVGFVNAGIMTLSQAIGVIMGANIGTTVTAQLVSFSLEDIAPIALGIGIIIYLAAKNQKQKQYAEILLGFGMLFTGMEFMKEAVSPLADLPQFRDALIYVGSHPLLGILAGFLITGIVQSSSASMGMLIALASQGILPLSAALPILYGDNIGTCVTSLLSSLGASKNAKRAAFMHLTFNVIGTILFIVVFTKPISMVVSYLDPNNIARQIANAHTLFNIVNVIILLPFSKYIVKFVLRLIPVTEEEEEASEVKYIDERMIETPSIAVGNAVLEVKEMAEYASKSLEYAVNGVLNYSEDELNKTFEMEAKVNEIQKQVLSFLVKLSKVPLNEDERNKVTNLIYAVTDIERISDHGENIAELGKNLVSDKLSFSEHAQNEIREIYTLAAGNFKDSMECLDEVNLELRKRVHENEKQVDLLELGYRNHHLQRLNEGRCTVDAGVIYFDILTNLERVSDHCKNIADYSYDV